MRPPGGLLGDGGTQVTRDSGLTYCSPAGAGAGIENDLALLPFQWRHVDATSLLPPLAPIREQVTGSPDPITPAGFVDYLGTEIDRLRAEGGFLAIVFHLHLVHQWLGEESLGHILSQLSTPQVDGDLWIAPMRDVAGYVLKHQQDFAGGAVLDATSWT